MNERRIEGWRATGREDYPKDGEGFFNGAGEVLVCRGHWLHEAGTRRIAAPVYAGEDAADLAARVRKLEGYFVPDANGEVLNLADFMLSIDMRFAALERATSTDGQIGGPPTSPWRKCPACGAEWDTSFVGMCDCLVKPKVIPAPSPVTVHAPTPAPAKVEAGEKWDSVREASRLIYEGLRCQDWGTEKRKYAVAAYLDAARTDGLAARKVPDKVAVKDLVAGLIYRQGAAAEPPLRQYLPSEAACARAERILIDAIFALLTPEPPHATT